MQYINKVCPFCKSNHITFYEIYDQKQAKTKLDNKDYQNDMQKNDLELFTKLTDEEISLMLQYQESFGRFAICDDCDFLFLEKNNYSKLDFKSLTIISREAFINKYTTLTNMFMPKTFNLKEIRKFFLNKVLVSNHFYSEILNDYLKNIIYNNLNYANFSAVERIQKQIEYTKWLESEKKKKDTCGTYDFCKYCDKKLENPCAHAVEKIRIELNERPFQK